MNAWAGQIKRGDWKNLSSVTPLGLNNDAAEDISELSGIVNQQMGPLFELADTFLDRHAIS